MLTKLSVKKEQVTLRLSITGATPGARSQIFTIPGCQELRKMLNANKFSGNLHLFKILPAEMTVKAKYCFLWHLESTLIKEEKGNALDLIVRIFLSLFFCLFTHVCNMCSLKNILKTQKWKIQKVEVPQKSSLWVIIVTELMYIHPEGFPGGTIGKELVCQCRRHKRCKFNPWVGKIPWKGMAIHSNILA